ncbi:MAG: IS3 family transposase [Acidobacteria bacterium]|nr:IS3 family transposase [Acidobacteriota bacterium]
MGGAAKKSLGDFGHRTQKERRDRLMAVVREQRGEYGVQPICAALGVGRASYYREQRPSPRDVIERIHPRALSLSERQDVLGALNSQRFCDQAPGQVYATLLDQGRYLCSERTMYRILAEHQQVRERRDQLRRPSYQAPELIASRQNEVWSWDITKLLGPTKWTYFYLYVILDIFSRYVVGWMLAYRESAELAKRLIGQTIERHAIESATLTVHADRGAPMTSKALAFFLAGLGVTKTHSRPYVSNDNPYSESQFKTMKYRPEFPDRFGCYQDAHRFCAEFFSWYNHEHHHSGLGYLTPHEVHYGLAEKRSEQRAGVLQQAYEKNPQRFVRGLPQPPLLPTAAWINKPKEISRTEGSEIINLSMTGIEQKNGFHICPITNDPPSGGDLGRGENKRSEDLVV